MTVISYRHPASVKILCGAMKGWSKGNITGGTTLFFEMQFDRPHNVHKRLSP